MSRPSLVARSKFSVSDTTVTPRSRILDLYQLEKFDRSALNTALHALGATTRESENRRQQ